jgi:Cu-Zn family superoxide dismutase
MGRKARRRAVLGAAAAAVLVLGAVAAFAQTDASDAEAGLFDGAGNAVGSVKFFQGAGGKVEVRVRVSGLTPGFHGMHVHTIGTCTAPDFTSAGGHFNPTAASHPGHAADGPVILVNADGRGWARFRTDRYAVDDLFDADGSAVVVHANPDNYANIPTDRYDPDPDATTLATGDAGARVACGVVVVG